MDIMMGKLWGKNYFDGNTKQWGHYDEAEDGSILKRGFVQFIMEPIIKLFRLCIEDNNTEIDKILTVLSINLNDDEKKLIGNNKMKVVFQKWINAADSILEMIILQLPSPVKA